MKVHDVMTTHVQGCSPSTDLAAAAVIRLSWEDCERLLRPKVARFATGRIGATAAERQHQKPHMKRTIPC